MNLSELKKAVNAAVERAKEYGESPDEIEVSLQLEDQSPDPLWARENIELHYDNNLNASGCVLTGDLDEACL